MDAHAAYGELFHTEPGELLFTSFTLDEVYVWTLQMGVVGDASRVSKLRVEQP